MFVQVMEGRIADRDGLRRQLERWVTELRPGATGFLGTTAGVSDDGRALAFARFASRADAMANSARPEQGAWWAETARCFDGDVAFTESEDVDEMLGGGSDAARFVQVMKSRDVDRERLHSLDALFEAHADSWRPDVLGGYRLWTGGDDYVEVVYFTSEAEARAGEQRQPPPEVAAHMGDYADLTAAVEFIDLRDPWIH